MATGKKYYWIKLKDTFLTSDKVDYLLSQKDGANYVVIYQMLCLKTINSNGVLGTTIGEVLIPYDEEKIQRDLKHFSIDTIRIAFTLYKNLGMVYMQENGLLKITEFNDLVGSETDYANQKRRQRIECGQNVDNGVDNVHIEIRDKRLEKRDKNILVKHKYGEYKNVLLDDEQLSKLKEEFPKDWEERIERVSEYVQSTGKTYKDYLATIRVWARKEKPIEEEKPHRYDKALW